MEALTHVTRVNGWVPALAFHLSYIRQNFRLFRLWNLPF